MLLKQVDIEDIELKYNPEELDKLTNDMNELKETFQIVHSLAAEQGESLNLVETEVLETDAKIESSCQELEKASGYQKAAIKKKGILYGLGIVAINIPLAPIIGIQFSLPLSLALTGGYLFSKKKDIKIRP